MPLTVYVDCCCLFLCVLKRKILNRYYRPLNKAGQPTEGEGLLWGLFVRLVFFKLSFPFVGKELGQAIVPLTTFLPLIGTSETVSQWMPVTDKVCFSSVCFFFSYFFFLVF